MSKEIIQYKEYLEILPCKKYLEDKLGETISDKVFDDSSGDMRVFTISDIDLYHRVAQSLGITALWKKSNIHYQIDLPTQPGWSIILPRDKIKRFEEKYCSLYNIVKASERPIKADCEKYIN